MIRQTVIKSFIILSLIALPTAAFAGPGKALIGTWQAKSMLRSGKSMPMPGGMNMTVTFKATSYSFMMKMGKQTQSESGTWSVSGNKLHTTTMSKGKTKKKETVTFKLNGNNLVIDNKGMTLTFVRLAKKK